MNRIIFLILLTVCSQNLFADIYVYKAPFKESTGFYLDTCRRELTMGDVADDVKFCNSNDDYICFYSDIFYFSVPRDLQKKEWELRNKNFSIVSISKERLLGKEYEIVHILHSIPKSDQKDSGSVEYLYSVEYGLIGFILKPATGSEAIFFVKSEKGFGAQSDSNSCK